MTRTSGTTPETTPSKRRLPVLVLLPLFLFVALAALFLVQLTIGRDPSVIPSALLDKPAPATDLPPIEGFSDNGTPVPGFSNADFEGNLTVVNVFASWCVPCRQEHPFLEELSRRPDIQMIAINYKDPAENARRFLSSFGNPFDRIGADEKGRMGIEWGVTGVPETFLVDPDGVIRYKLFGPLTPANYEDFVGRIEALKTQTISGNTAS